MEGVPESTNSHSKLFCVMAERLTFVENGLIFNVSHFPRVSHFNPKWLTLENGLVLKVSLSDKIKPTHIGINSYFTRNHESMPFSEESAVSA